MVLSPTKHGLGVVCARVKDKLAALLLKSRIMELEKKW
jgi:hypothetical protein